MSEYLRVRRASLAMSSVVVLIVTLAACDADSVAPTAIAPTSTAASVDAIDGQSANVKAGQYAYLGCFTEAQKTDNSPLPPATAFFDPPVCIPVTLAIFDDGRWSLDFPWTGYTTPDHPGWTFWVGDILSWVSRNGKCSGVADPNFPLGANCISEARYVRSMIFSDFVDGLGLGSVYRVHVKWTYSPGKP